MGDVQGLRAVPLGWWIVREKQGLMPRPILSATLLVACRLGQQVVMRSYLAYHGVRECSYCLVFFAKTLPDTDAER